MTQALENSEVTVCVKDGERLVGMGRAIGDGAMAYYIKDVAVVPEYQGKGIGAMVVRGLLEGIHAAVPAGYKVSVELIASGGREPFYEKLGFASCPNSGMGHGMMAMFAWE